MDKLRKIFNSHKKADLMDIADFFGLEEKPSLKKNEMVEYLSEQFASDPVKWLTRLPERDIKLIKRLIAEGPGKALYLNYPDYPTIVETLRIIDNDNSDDNFRKISLHKELFDIVSPHIDSVISQNEANGTYSLERMILGYLNIYGVISVSEFVDQVIDNFDVNDPADIEQLITRISSNPLIRIYHDSIDAESYFFSPAVPDFKYILSERDSFKEIKDFKKFQLKEALEAGQSAPYNCFRLNTAQGERLMAMLTNLGYSEEELFETIHNIWMDSQFTMDDESTEEIFSCVTARQEMLPDFAMYKSCIETIAEYANILPKWLLKGHSADEADLMKISIKVDDDSDSDTSENEPLKVNLHYDLSSLCTGTEKTGLQWMIFLKPGDKSGKSRRIIN